MDPRETPAPNIQGLTREQAQLRLKVLIHEYVDGWMMWRRDRARWIDRMITAEVHQAGYLFLLERHGGQLSGCRVLDLGCGIGGFSAAAVLRGSVVIALDPNRDHLAIARMRFAFLALPGLPALQAHGETLPLKSEAFDFVAALQVLEHVTYPQQVLQEINRVLKPGGLALVTYQRRRAFVEPHYQLPLLQWVPPRLARWVVRKTGRRLEREPTGRIQIEEMHYSNGREFSGWAREAGFADCIFTEPVQLEMVRHPAKRELIRVLHRLGLSGLPALALRLRTSARPCVLVK